MSAPEPPRRPWLALGVTGASQVLASVALSTAPVVAPAVAPQLGYAPERVGVFVGVAYAMGMLTGLASGAWVARFGATRLTLVMLALLAASAVLATAAPPALPLLAAAALIGVGYGVVNPAAADILGRHAPPGAPGLFFAIKQAGVPAGVGLAGLLMPAGLLAIGWRGTAWTMAGVFLLLALAMWPSITRLDADRAARGAPASAHWRQVLASVLRQPALRRLALVSLAYAMAQQTFVTFVVSLLYFELHLPLVQAAGLLAASQAACVVVRVAGGHTADRWVHPRVLLGGFGLVMAASLLALALLPATAGVGLAMLCVGLAGATTMGWNGVFFAELVRCVPRAQLAAAAGGTQFFIFAGGMTGPLLFGLFLTAGASHAASYLAFATFAAVAALAMLRARDNDRANPSLPSVP